MIEKNMRTYWGHTAAQEQIFGALRRNRLPHALLFSGPEGVGKATLALQLAACLFAGEQGVPDASDPVVCRMLAGSHGDLKYLVPPPEKASGEITVDQIRQLGRFLSQTPLEGGWRIAIIDGALNRQAGNALLKILEEPPEKSLVIVLVHQSGTILPTIRSRCQQVLFRPVEEADLRGVFNTVMAAAPFPAVLLPFCQGRPGYGIALDQAGGVEIVQDLRAQGIFPQTPQPRIVGFCEKYAAKPRKDTMIDRLPFVLDLLNHLAQEEATRVVRTASGTTSLNQARNWAEGARHIQDVAQGYRHGHLDRLQTLLSAVNAFCAAHKPA